MVNSLFERLLENDSRVIAFDCEDPDSAIAQFRLICRRSGRSIYVWNDRAGLVSLKDAEISVPGSRPLVDALRYVLQSMHYGVYLMTGFEPHLNFPSVNHLKRLCTDRQPDDRKVILLGHRMRLPDPMPQFVEFVEEERVPQLNPRLRDGRWVVS